MEAPLHAKGGELPSPYFSLDARDTVEKEVYWEYLIQVIEEQATRAIAALRE